MVKADFHIHSTISDCSFSREEILQKAKDVGLTYLSFTDHDTTQEWKEGLALCRKHNIVGFSGIEISAFDKKSNKKAHIIGLNYEKTRPLDDLCADTLRKRNHNCLKKIEILGELGFEITYEDVKKYAGETIYKQHILEYLVESNQEKQIFGETYRTILKNGGPCDFDIDYVSAEDAVKAIKESGGLAILAHPGQQKNYEIVPSLVDVGLDGIELNLAHNKPEKDIVKEIAKQHGLFLSGGSDFHGRYEANGIEIGDYLVPEYSNIFRVLGIH